jgi:hypothetical protein
VGRERVSIEWLRDSGDAEEPLLCPRWLEISKGTVGAKLPE